MNMKITTSNVAGILSSPLHTLYRMKRILNHLLVVVVCAVCHDSYASEKVVYKHNTDRDLVMTITKPTGWSETDRRPSILFFYNGGWKDAGATKPQFETQARYFADRGMVVGQADYREKSKDGPTSSKCVEDIFSCVRWLRSHAAELGIDPKRIAAVGGSGSIHLPAATLLVDEVQPKGENASIDPLPNAMFLFNPDPDVLDPTMMSKLIENRLANQTSKVPPMVIYYGSRDAVAPFLDTFVVQAKQAGLPVEKFIGEGGVHGFFKFSPGLEQTLQHMDDRLCALGLLDRDPKADLPHKEAPADYEERILKTQKRWLERHNEITKARPASIEFDRPTASSPPSSHIYQVYGERNLQIAMHYPTDWKSSDQRTAILFFSGSHKVQPNKDGQLPPLAAERASRGLPVVNRGPGGEQHIAICDAFANQGYVCMRVEYRTRGKDGVLPGDDIADAVSAMRWVRGHASSLGVATDRIVAAGGSSGGYLAASLFAFEDRYSTAGDASVSARPNAILLYSPLVDWLEVGSMSESFLVVLNGDKELGASVSPARHWNKDCPPTLIMVGNAEPPFETVRTFAEKWKAAGAPMELFVADGGEHGFFGKPTWIEKTIARTLEFLRLHNLSSSNSLAPLKTVAADQESPALKEKLETMLRKAPEADSNKDGVLTMEEAKAFKTRSKNTTSIPKNEPMIIKLENEGRATATVPGTAPSQAWDSDRDGKISKAEFKAPSQLFQNMDIDGDGFLADKELAKLDSKLNLEKTGETTWVVPPERQYHGVSHHRYLSESMKTEVGYNIYLPDDYEKSDKRYPVIYHLHGSGGNESVQTDLSVVYHNAIEKEQLVPVIVVFVNGGRRSYYSDSADGKILAETTIIKELIPHIDSTYRTIPEKTSRAIHGFSMGGFGALKIGLKYPELFCAVLSFSGGMASPDSVHMDFLSHILGNNEALIKANNPADIAIKNKAALNEITLWLFTGTRDVAQEDSQWAHQFLTSHGIEHRFEISEDTGHALKRHFDFFGDDIFAMLNQHFTSRKSNSQRISQLESVDLNTQQYIMALGGVQQGIAATLLAALSASEKDERMNAIRQLAAIGPPAKEAIPALKKLLQDEDWLVRRAAFLAIERIEPKANVKGD